MRDCICCTGLKEFDISMGQLAMDNDSRSFKHVSSGQHTVAAHEVADCRYGSELQICLLCGKPRGKLSKVEINILLSMFHVSRGESDTLWFECTNMKKYGAPRTLSAHVQTAFIH